jgi:hypothetical protein
LTCTKIFRFWSQPFTNMERGCEHSGSYMILVLIVIGLIGQDWMELLPRDSVLGYDAECFGAINSDNQIAPTINFGY